MSLDRIIAMIINQIMRRLINSGISGAMGFFARRNNPPAKPGESQGKADPQSDHSVAASRDAAKRARIAARTIRKL